MPSVISLPKALSLLSAQIIKHARKLLEASKGILMLQGGQRDHFKIERKVVSHVGNQDIYGTVRKLDASFSYFFLEEASLIYYFNHIY